MRTLRYVLSALIGVLIAFGILVPAASMVAPAIGREIFAIRGHSMSPTIPMGAAILVTRRDVAEVHPGDIVTWQSPNGAYVTHRVLQIVEENGQLLLQTKGDANDSPDPSAVPASAFIGVVDGWVPAAGYGMILMSTPTGLISWLSFGLAMLVADAYIATLMKEREARTRPADAERPTSGEAAPRKRRPKTADPDKAAKTADRPKRATRTVAAGKLEAKTADPPKPPTRKRVRAATSAKGRVAVAASAATAARPGKSE